MYGSSDSHRFFTSTSPSFGEGAGDSTSLKFCSLTHPVGKLATVHALFCGMSLLRIERGEAREVMVCVAELLRDHGQAPEGMAHLHLLGHAHAAVQLDRLLADEARVVGDLDLGRRHRPG